MKRHETLPKKTLETKLGDEGELNHDRNLFGTIYDIMAKTYATNILHPILLGVRSSTMVFEVFIS